MTFCTQRWWSYQPHAPAALTPGMFLVLIFTWGWVDPRAMVRSEVYTSLKNPVTLSGIDPGTFRLVVQRLNHYATPGPCGVRRPERDADHSNALSCKTKNEWVYVYASPICLHVTYRDKFTFAFFLSNLIVNPVYVSCRTNLLKPKR